MWNKKQRSIYFILRQRFDNFIHYKPNLYYNINKSLYFNLHQYLQFYLKWMNIVLI
jgi:hypothetical protein